MKNMKLLDGWKIEKLGAFTQIKAGGTPSRSNNKFWDNGDIPWLKISDLKSKHISQSEEKITTFAIENSSAKVFRKGTILYTIFATLGEVAILDIEASTNQAIVGISINSEDIVKEYLYYFLKSIKGEICGKGRGVAQNNINMSILKDIEVILPPIEIQKKIVEVLEKAEKALEKRKEANRLLDELVKSRFVDMFGDPVINPKNWMYDKLENVTLKITDGKHGDCQNEENSGFYFISAKDINERRICTENSRQITKVDFDETNKRTMLQVGDIVIVNTGATIGKTAIATESDVSKNLTFQKSVAIVTVNPNKLLSEFLEQYIIFDRDNIYANSSGSAQKNWLLSQMRAYRIMIPPMELQNEFLKFIKQVDKLKFEMEKSLEELENLFNSLMKDAFNGELFNYVDE